MLLVGAWLSKLPTCEVSKTKTTAWLQDVTSVWAETEWGGADITLLQAPPQATTVTDDQQPFTPTREG